VSQSRFQQALADGDALLANDPFSSAAMVLKGRALVGLGQQDEAIRMLTKQVQAQPTDVGSLQLLARIYVRQGDWAKTAEAARRIAVQAPADGDNLLLLVQAAFLSGNAGLGRAASARLLQPNAEPALIASVLELWQNYWSSPQRIQDARALASAAGGRAQRLAYAEFLTRFGSPLDAVRLSADAAKLPVTAQSAEANAVLADALLRLGKITEAKSRFDAVIGFDPGNATALRGRTELELKTGDTTAAIEDAQKLVTVLPSSSGDRLLLARCYDAAGKPDWVRRTLWAAFQDIPADQRIFAALLTARKGDPDATAELQEEFARQQDSKLRGGFL
jgi:predicted Zn-dependent protease